MAAEKNFENKVKTYLKNYGCWLFLGIEVKADKGEPSLLQLYNLRKIRESGGYGILLYPKDFEQFKKFNENKSKLNAWYLGNIEEQKRWEIKLSK